MAYPVPTAADLIARYPAFADVAPATLDLYIADGTVSGADQSWPENVYAPAVLAYAAHQMALVGIGAHGETAEWQRQGISEVRSGAFTAKFAEGASGRTGLSATPYGRAYAALLRRAKGGPRLAGGAARTDGWGPLAVQNDGGILPWGC